MKIKNDLFAIVVIAGSIWLSVTPARLAAATITVTTTNDSGIGSLRAALAAAGNGDTINFSLPAPATIVLTNGGLPVTTNVTIFGSGAANLAVSGNNSNRVFNIASNRVVTVSGLTIRDGYPGSGTNGGGIYNAGTLTLSNCVVSFNTAGDGSGGVSFPGANGGGVFNADSLTVIACTFKSNSGGTGGVGCNYSALSHCLSPGGDGGNGGGIFNGGSLTVTSSSFSDNSGGTGGQGGGSAIGSVAPAPGGTGGAGGGIYSTGSLACVSCTFSGNRSGNGGPGGTASGTFVNVGVGGSGGNGGVGGGIYNFTAAASATLRNTLVAQNPVGAGGPGGFGFAGNGSSGGPGSAPDLSGAFTSQGHDLIGMADGSTGFTNASNGNIVGTGNSPVGPLLGALKDNGGPTPTMALLTGSPAVDAGDDALTGTDQRGFPRLSGPHVDIGAFEGAALAAETLLVGDGINNTVVQIELRSGASLGAFVMSGAGSSYQLVGPRGLLCISNLLLVVNQNANTPYNGEVLKFNPTNGAFLGKLIPNSNPNSPYAPRGMIAGPDGTIYVADVGGFDGVNFGKVVRFNLQGQFLGNLDTTGLAAAFYPMAMVIGPDGMLYVSGVGNLASGDASGYVFRFQYNAGTQTFHYHDTLIASTAVNFYSSGLHAPEGLVFGPDGNLYITSFLAQYLNSQTNSVTDLDSILVFNTNGQRVGSPIYLYPTNAPRVFAQALLFGPRGDLFVPTTSSTGVRRYSASANFQQYTVLPVSGVSPQQPWYLTFRATSPRTLAYQAPSLGLTGNGNALDVSWPATYVGWQLQAQTNTLSAGLKTNWVNVAGSDSTNHLNSLINTANPTVFYRLAAP
jgi:hypothetical protein